MTGYDTSFPVACAEDIELSYRMSARGWKMKFVPDAIVYHTHPDTLSRYLRKKYKFAFWRVLAVRKNPARRERQPYSAAHEAATSVRARSSARPGRGSGNAPIDTGVGDCARGFSAEYAAICYAGSGERSDRWGAFSSTSRRASLCTTVGHNGRPAQCPPSECALSRHEVPHQCFQ